MAPPVALAAPQRPCRSGRGVRPSSPALATLLAAVIALALAVAVAPAAGDRAEKSKERRKKATGSLSTATDDGGRPCCDTEDVSGLPRDETAGVAAAATTEAALAEKPSSSSSLSALAASPASASAAASVAQQRAEAEVSPSSSSSAAAGEGASAGSAAASSLAAGGTAVGAHGGAGAAAGEKANAKVVTGPLNYASSKADEEEGTEDGTKTPHEENRLKNLMDEINDKFGGSNNGGLTFEENPEKEEQGKKIIYEAKDSDPFPEAAKKELDQHLEVAVKDSISDANTAAKNVREKATQWIEASRKLLVDAHHVSRQALETHKEFDNAHADLIRYEMGTINNTIDKAMTELKDQPAADGLNMTLGGENEKAKQEQANPDNQANSQNQGNPENPNAQTEQKYPKKNS